MVKYEIERWITKNGVHIPIINYPKFKGYDKKTSKKILKEGKRRNETQNIKKTTFKGNYSVEKKKQSFVPLKSTQQLIDKVQEMFKNSEDVTEVKEIESLYNKVQQLENDITRTVNQGTEYEDKKLLEENKTRLKKLKQRLKDKREDAYYSW